MTNAQQRLSIALKMEVFKAAGLSLIALSDSIYQLNSHPKTAEISANIWRMITTPGLKKKILQGS
jgi:hypothetical protein